jgi:hypothetical protein
VEIEFGQLDHAALAEDPEAVVEGVTGDLGPAITQSAGRFPGLAIDLDDVVLRDLALLVDDEAAVEIGLVGR